jgi:MFS family permease
MVTIDSRRVLLPVSIATGLSLLGDSAMYTVLPTHYGEIGVALGTIGILLSANRFVRLFLNAPIGLLTDRWPRRWIFIPAIFLGVLSTAIYALVPGFGLLLAGRILWGVAWAGIWVSGNAIVLDATVANARGRGVGIYQISFFLGASSGAILGGILTDSLGYQPAMAIAASLSLLGALVALFYLPETRNLRPFDLVTETAGNDPARQTDWPQLTSATSVYGTNRLVVAGVLTATFGLFLSQRLGDLITIGSISLGVATITGLGLGASTLLAMVAAPSAGTISDRIGSRWAVAGGGLLSGTTGFILLSIGYPITILLGLPMISAASGSNQSLSTALIGDLSPSKVHGRRLGVMYTVGDLASAIGPPIAYALVPIIGLAALYRFSAGLFGVMLLLALWWNSRARRLIKN